jgi:hypothetical protein
MIQTVEAIIDASGPGPVHLPSARRALKTILKDRPRESSSETAPLSEAALAKDWGREIVLPARQSGAWAIIAPKAKSAIV